MRKNFLIIFAALMVMLTGTVQAVDTFDYKAFGKLPVSFNGRFQPMDSLARNSLLQIREKQSLYLKEEKRSMPAIEWLAEVMIKPEIADDRKVFRVDHPDLISMLKLPEKNEAAGQDGKHFSWILWQRFRKSVASSIRKFSARQSYFTFMKSGGRG